MAWPLPAGSPRDVALRFALRARSIRKVLVVAAFAGGLALLTPAPARAAQAPGVTKAPRGVPYGGEATIRVATVPKGKVHLERRSGGRWRFVRRGLAAADGVAKIVAWNLERTSTYRVTHAGDASDEFRIEVRAGLNMIVSPGHTLSGKPVELRGTLLPVVPGRRVELQERSRGRWRPLRTVPVEGGSFTTTFVPDSTGPGVVRARFAGDEVNSKRINFAVMTIFQRSVATWYGPGFFGNGTACGQVYTDQIIGVAHRTLPCGTNVTIFFNGIVLTVPVIDRGPYSDADWDLSAEAARRLGFSGKQEVGVLMATEPGE